MSLHFSAASFLFVFSSIFFSPISMGRGILVPLLSTHSLFLFRPRFSLLSHLHRWLNSWAKKQTTLIQRSTKSRRTTETSRTKKRQMLNSCALLNNSNVNNSMLIMLYCCHASGPYPSLSLYDFGYPDGCVCQVSHVSQVNKIYT